MDARVRRVRQESDGKRGGRFSLEARRAAVAFAREAMAVVGDDSREGRESGEDGGEAAGISPHEFHRAIAPSVGTRRDRLVGEISPEVVGECGRGGVAVFGSFFERLGYDRVEVA